LIDGTCQAGVSDSARLAVRLWNPSFACTECTFPENNFIGAILLGKLLKERIEGAGVRCLSELGVGELNDGLVIMEIADRADLGTALESIKETLQVTLKQMLGPFTAVGWFCEAELVWRCVFPHHAVTPFDIDAELGRMSEKLGTALSMMEIQQQRNNEIIEEALARHEIANQKAGESGEDKL
jgi:hypothetical protein